MTCPGGRKMAALCVGVRMMEAAVAGLLEQDLTEGELRETLRGLREHGALRGEGSSASLSYILRSCNSRLLSPASRVEGLSLLSLVVEESPTDVFQQHCVSWIRSVLQVIQSQDPPRVISLAVFVVRSLLAHSSALPELSREVSTNHIPGLLTSLLGLRRQCLIPALEGIRACLISYPRACGSLRGKLTAFFLSLLDEENVQIQELACQCFSLLPSLGSGFSQGVKHTENWERQIQSIICSLHAVFQQLYQTAETDPTHYEGPGTELELPVLEDDGASSFLQLVRRFTALGQCVRLLVREQFPAPVRVPLSDILNLVCRVANLNTKNLSWQGEESLQLLLLPQIHRSALEILESTILASLRALVYRTLERWVSVCGGSSGILQGMSHHSDILLAHLMSDVTPPTDNVKISGFVQIGTKKQKVSEVGNGDFQGHRKREATANTELCTAALRALCTIVLYGGSLIKEDTHRRLQELSIPLLIRLQQGSDQWVGPYANSDCRKQLYRLLLSLTLTPSPRLTAPLHCAVRIFRAGMTEESLQVSMFCTEALAICRVIIHPRVPTLQRPLPQHGPRPPLQADVPTQRLPAPPLAFPAPSLANHLSARATGPLQPMESQVAPPMPSPQETFGGKTPRPVFIHYEKEEASDVEISLESDSDDSVVIVPEGLLQKPAPKPEPSPPSVKPPPEEAMEPPAPAVASPPAAAVLSPPPPACPGPSPGPAQLPVAAELPPPPPEGDMVININSTDEEEEEDEEEELYDEDDEFFDEEEEEEDEEDIEGLDEEEEDFYDDEGLSEEEDEDMEGEDEEEEGEEEEGEIHEDMQITSDLKAMHDAVEAMQAIHEEHKPVLHEVEPEEGPPRLSPVEDEGEDTGLLMLVESEEREAQVEESQDRVSEAEVISSPPPPPPPVLTPPPASAPVLAQEEESVVSESEPLPEPESPVVTEEPAKKEEEHKKPEVVVEEEEEVIQEPEEMRDADSMLADFNDCPPDDDKVPEPVT